jgi:hypothetical protein
MDELPYYVQGEIIIDYLFTDFLYIYRSYFRPITGRDNQSYGDAIQSRKQRGFLVEFVKCLEPRFYL